MVQVVMRSQVKITHKIRLDLVSTIDSAINFCTRLSGIFDLAAIHIGQSHYAGMAAQEYHRKWSQGGCTTGGP